MASNGIRDRVAIVGGDSEYASRSTVYVAIFAGVSARRTGVI